MQAPPPATVPLPNLPKPVVDSFSELHQWQLPVAAAVGLLTWQYLEHNEERRKSMRVNVFAPPFIFSSDKPIDAAVIGFAAGWTTLMLMRNQVFPLFLSAAVLTATSAN
jgi:hypothetical protein